MTHFFSFKKKIFLSFIVPIFLTALAGCVTLKPEDYQNYDENKLFNTIQLKQQACVTKKEYNNVITLYQYYIEKFPEKKDRVMESRYEIGYINYFLKNYDAAETIFRSIIADFEGGADQYALKWIEVLSIKLRDEITAIKTQKILEADAKQKKLKRSSSQEEE